MPSFKVRQGSLFTAGLTTGSLGNAVSKLQVGTANVNAPSFAATGGASAATGTITVPNAATTDSVWLSAASAPTGLLIKNAYVSAASVITIGFEASPCTAIASCALTLNYLLIAGS